MSETIKKNPLLIFLALTFTSSWVTWFTAAALTGNQGSLLGATDLAGAFAPAISAIAVTQWSNPELANNSPTKRRLTFVVFFTTSLLIQLAANLFVSNYFSYQLALLSVVISALVAYIVSSIYHPNRAVAQMMHGLKPSSREGRWILIAFLLPFVLRLLGGFVGYALGEQDLLSISIESVASIIVSYPLIMLLGGPLNEEPGWRGFATPELGSKYTPLVTGVIVGIIWSTWHFPLHVTAFYSDGLDGFLLRYVFNVPLGVIFTWLYNKSSGSLFACVLLHTGVNVSQQLYTSTTNSSLYTNLLMVAFTFVIIFRDKMYRKPEPGSLG